MWRTLSLSLKKVELSIYRLGFHEEEYLATILLVQ